MRNKPLQNHDLQILLCISGLFIALVIICNLIYRKFVYINFIDIYTFEISVATALFPVTFFLNDLVVELYGAQYAKITIRAAVFTDLVICCVMTVVDHIPATTWSMVSDQQFRHMFGQYHVALLSSACATFIAQNCDVFIYSYLKRLTGKKLIWLRLTASTTISLLIDTTVVLLVMVLLKALPAPQVPSLIFGSYGFKILSLIAYMPAFYLAIYIINKSKRSSCSYSHNKPYKEQIFEET